MVTSKDREIVRNLATQYMDVCQKDIQDERRGLWRKKNSLKSVRPLIYLRGGVAWNEVPEIVKRETEDSLCQQIEGWFRKMLYWESANDDSIFEPWYPVSAVYKHTGWGFEYKKHQTDSDGSWVHEAPLKDLDDLSGMVKPQHIIDEEATAELVSKVTGLIGDIIEIDVQRKPYYFMWMADISTCLGYIRGIEQIMYDMMDNPEGLHKLLSFMRDGILATHEKYENTDGWRLADHQNQAMSYSEELEDPKANSRQVKRSDLWVYCASQEYTLISPDMHDEFLLQYQKPIIEKFGLSAYGCCEDLTNKIDMLRQIKNLRRIAVSPMANLKKSAEQIGTDYVISWRPSPADMVCCSFNEDFIRKTTEEAIDICKGQHMDITLKDVQTVQNKPERLKDWVRVTRETIEKCWKS
ncbi:MAG: hypothetical protein ACYTFY_04855 [Planctomycetota bacterium]|jgi:hypothetical protein